MKDLKSFTEELITTDINNYKNAADDAEKESAYNKLITHYKLDTAERKVIIENGKLIEQERNDEFRRKQEKARLDLEEKRFEMEKERLSLEKQRYEDEVFDRRRRIAREEKSEKIALITTIVSIAVPAVVTIISKCIYASLAFNAQKHDYKDYVMESKYSKEARDNLNK